MKLSFSTLAVRLAAISLIFVTAVADAADPIRVAVFQGSGVGVSVNELLQVFENHEDEVDVRRITPEQIASGDLTDVDVLIHPGGSGSKQGKALGEEGRERVRNFVDDGGSYLGICAGGYLATNYYSWSLNLIDAKVVDRAHWARGTGMVQLQLSPSGCSLFSQDADEVEIYYGQGPLLGRHEWDDPDVPDYESLAIYKTEIAEKGAPNGVMPGTSAIVRTNYGQGRVFCFSPHPEKTDGLGEMVMQAVRWLGNVEDADAVEDEDVSHIIEKRYPASMPGGIAVLVTRDGEVLHRKGYGVVNGRPMTSHTPLRLASVTKQFAAMCAAMLIEEGRLDITEEVTHYLPDLELPKEGRQLRIHDLLWHSSGLANFIKAKEKAAILAFRKERGLDYLTNETHAEWLGTMDLKRAPGQEFEYTNSGYVLLARVIEVVAGEPFHVFQQRRIFDVLGMTETTDSSRFNGSGNMATTLVDYAKWDAALWNQDSRLLSPDGYRMLFTRGLFDNGEPIPYGFGWRLTYRDDELFLAEHGGVGSGKSAARNQIERHFDDRTTVAIFAQENPNFHKSKREALAAEIYETLLD